MKDEKVPMNSGVLSPASGLRPSASVLFVAGDLSGDAHAAGLAREIQSTHADWKLFAVGGAQLQAVGATMVGDTRDCGVMGIGPALALVPRLVILQKRILRFLRATPIDAVVLCDWGGFNARLLPHLAKLGVPVLYYFPPRSWRRDGRGVGQIAPFVNRVATPFEWSAKHLQNAGCRAEWVGHPLLETVEAARAKTSREDLRREWNVEGGEKLIALLPGSRNLELKYIAPHLSKAAKLLESTPEFKGKFVVAVPRGAKAKVRAHFDETFEIVENRATEVLLACDAAAVKSGTATLEAAVADAPCVVVYDGPAILKLQWKLMGGSNKIPLVAMPNILLGRMSALELLGIDCKSQSIATELQKLLFDQLHRAALQNDYGEVRRALGSALPLGASARTRQILEEMLASRI